jgi:hypothetical protein
MHTGSRAEPRQLLDAGDAAPEAGDWWTVGAAGLGCSRCRTSGGSRLWEPMWLQPDWRFDGGGGGTPGGGWRGCGRLELVPVMYAIFVLDLKASYKWDVQQLESPAGAGGPGE